MTTILVAEDNPASRELIREILEAHNFSVLEAADGEQARALLSERPHLVLLDIRMPRGNGFEILQAIRSDVLLGRIPVFAVTAFAMEGDREHALAAGFDDYISKPISQKELIAKIRSALDRPLATSC
ncbi:MAG: response regulator [Candidatus Korobacteraceae bacterium]